MFNLKKLAKNYNLEVVDLDDCYYKVSKKLKRMEENNIDLFNKIIKDKLEEIGLSYKDVELVSEYYTELKEEEMKQEEELTNEVLSSDEEPINVIEKKLNKNCMDGDGGDVIQTSNNTGIDLKIGRNRPKGYKTEIINIYNNR